MNDVCWMIIPKLKQNLNIINIFLLILLLEFIYSILNSYWIPACTQPYFAAFMIYSTWSRISHILRHKNHNK